MKFFLRAKELEFSIPNFSNHETYFKETQCRVLNGKSLSAHFVLQAKSLVKEKKIPLLAVILAGENPASQVYVNNKVKTFKEAGFHSKIFLVPSDKASKHYLVSLVRDLNNDENVHGILVQLPLPYGLYAKDILNEIAPHKDVDGFLTQNLGLLLTEEYSKSFLACTPFGILTLLFAYGFEPARQHAVIIGRSHIVGKPLSLLLLGADATVTTVHSKTQNLKNICKQADILIAAAGQPEMVTKEFVKKNAIVIDVGIHKKSDGKLCGDVHPDVKRIAKALTPVPGGVGPMTIAMLLVNSALAAWAEPLQS